MATLIDADGFRERFDIDDEDSFPDQRIDPHIRSARTRLRQWVGTTNYAAAVAALAQDEVDRTEEDQEMLDGLQNAEAHLTYSYAIAGWNAPLSSKGVVATSQSDEGKEMRKYLTPDQTAQLASQFLELARSMADPWIAASDDVGVAIVTIDDDDTSAEGSTRYGTDSSC